MSVVLGCVITIGVVVLGITYCMLLGFFIRCFEEMFYSILDINEEWYGKIMRSRRNTKKSQKTPKKTTKDRLEEPVTVRDKDGKSYFHS